MNGKQRSSVIWVAPLPVVSTVLFLAEAAWFVANLRHKTGPPILGMLPVMVGSAVAMLAFHRASRAPGITAPAARFWRSLMFASGGIVIMQLPDLPAYAVRPTVQPNLASLAVYLAAIVTIVVALYRLPVEARFPGELLRLLLDSATVTVASVLIIWYLALSRMSAQTASKVLATTLPASVALAIVVLALAKVVLSGGRTIDPMALRMLGVGLAVEIAGLVATPLLADRPQVAVEPVGRAAMYVMVALAARYQRRASAAPVPHRPRPKDRVFSPLPYAAVAVVDIFLLYAIRDHSSAHLVIGAGAVALTGLVIARQLVAFRDNSRLIEEVAAQERRFRSLVQNATDVIAIFDQKGLPTYLSPGIEQLTGLPPAEWVARRRSPAYAEDLPYVTAKFREVLAEPGATVSYDARITHVEQGWRWVHVTHTNRLGDPAVNGVVTNLSDITEIRAYHDRLTFQATHDSLTGLANRSLFGAEVELALHRRDGHGLCLALVDLDDFKAVNDTFGHHVGDLLLVAVADRLVASVRPNDLVARLGGDEFAVLLQPVDPDQVDPVADRMLAALTQPLTIEGHDICVQASIGFAQVQPDDDPGRLMHRADIAMYQAKSAGKGRFARYDESMVPRTAERARLMAEIDHALGAGEFELHYQPIVTLPDGSITGVEALLRWRHPERGLLGPLEFIPAAEQTGLIVPIGRWVLATACQQAAQWLRDFPTGAPETVSVNVSPRQLLEPALVQDVAAALRAAGLPANRLVIEVTESAVVSTKAASTITALHGLGVRIALDDFGTGHSTLNLINDCPIDQLKLDRSFVGEAAGNPVAVAVAKIAEALGFETVAEGVESADQVGHLRELGYQLAQGFHFSRPCPAEAITALLAAEASVAATAAAA